MLTPFGATSGLETLILRYGRALRLLEADATQILPNLWNKQFWLKESEP